MVPATIFIESWLMMNQGQAYSSASSREVGACLRLARRGSDLEAFSRNPTRGGFAALALQPTAFSKCAAYVFLSY